MHDFTPVYDSKRMSTPEPSWLNAALTGDTLAFDRLVHHYRPRVMRLALRFFKNTWDAEDACQNIFLKVFIHAKQFQYKSSFSSWLYRLAYNECLDEIRKYQKKLQRDDHYYQTETLAPSPATPQEQSEFNQKRETVLALMTTLPPVLQDTLVTLDFQGVPLAQASERMHIKESTLRVRHHRAFKQLRQAIFSTSLLMPQPAFCWNEILNAA